MYRRGCLIAFIALWMLGTSAARATSAMPNPVAAAIRASGLPADSIAMLVQEVTADQPLIAFNAERAMLTGSVMKVLTTYAGLELLGPAYSWTTEVHATGPVRKGVLEGDLVIRGLGDPKITLESFWLLLRAVREHGVRDIRGDLVLDRSYYVASDYDPGDFDNEPLKPYNTLPDALLVNHKAVRLTLAPDLETRRVRITSEPPLAEIQIVNKIVLDNARCGNWRARLHQDARREGALMRFTFTGRLSAQCGEHARYYSVLAPQVYTAGLFRVLWTELGGRLRGSVREGPVPGDATLLVRQESPALAELVRDINKYSNNVMARQLYLELGTSAFGAPATTEKSERAVRQWLARKGLDMAGLTLENGSGLSRIERISAHGMGDLLLAAWRSPVMPELIASLPLVGVDGTFRHRLQHAGVNGHAHIKGGTIDGVRAIAGYVLDSAGHRFVVVCLINHPKITNADAWPVFDALLRWVHSAPGHDPMPSADELIRNPISDRPTQDTERQ